jgi:hypothetical protein
MHDRFPAARWLLAGAAVVLLAGAGGLSALALRQVFSRGKAPVSRGLVRNHRRAL